MSNVIINLLNETDLGSRQTSLFKLYDFSIIPIEFVSNVYESFIGQENQEKEGAYYTPLFLVDYILKETVDKKFSENNELYNCRVFDPACGSGIFLVETLRKIIDQYLINYPNAKEQPESFKKTLQSLAKDNIYGVDKNLSAIQVAIFSIYLTLLDYQEPSDIETFEFPKLLDKNFFVVDFFDFDNSCFKEQLNIEFDFILGNPPWKRGQEINKKSLFIDYIKLRKNQEYSKEIEVSISDNQIVQAFLLRVSDFSVTNSCVLIVSSKAVLYNSRANNFRKYLLHNFLIDKVFELSPVRHEIFDKSNDSSVAPAAIIFYQDAKGKNTNNNVIEHIALKPSRFFSLFKVFSLSRNDIKQVEQKNLKDYDWLWKILVYGSYLDFNFIKRLKDGNNYSSIQKELENTKKFKKGVGIKVNGGEKNDASHLVGLPYIDRKNIHHFFIDKELIKWTINCADRPRESILYQPPMLLVSGISNTFCFNGAAICYINAVFIDSVTSVKVLNEEDVRDLRVMLAILTSSFFSYYALEVYSTVGIEREKSLVKEKWSVPYSYNENIAKTVEELESILAETSGVFNNKAAEKKLELDEKVLQLFDLSDTEKSLIDYANDIIIPIQQKHEEHEKLFYPIQFHSTYLEDYARLYLNRFKPSLDNEEQRFVIEVWHTNQLIGMLFKIISISEYKEDIIWSNDKSNINIISLCISLSSEKITDKLFIQKDIRGFEEDYFYIFKPNEKRLWHKAIGYLDVNEFMDALLKTEKDL